MFRIISSNKGVVRPIIAPAVDRSNAVQTVQDRFVKAGRRLTSLFTPAPVPFSFLFTVLFLIEKFRGKPVEEVQEFPFEGEVMAFQLKGRDRVPRFSIKRCPSTSEDEAQNYEIMPGSWKGKRDEDYVQPKDPVFVNGVLLEEKKWVPIAKGAKIQSGELIGTFEPPRPARSLTLKFNASNLEGFVEKYSAYITPDSIFLPFQDPWSDETQLGFDLRFQDGSPLLSGEGTIIEVRKADPNHPDLPAGIWVRFDKLSPKNRKMLERIIAALPHINSIQDVEELKKTILDPSTERGAAERALKALREIGLNQGNEMAASFAREILDAIFQQRGDLFRQEDAPNQAKPEEVKPALNTRVGNRTPVTLRLESTASTLDEFVNEFVEKHYSAAREGTVFIRIEGGFLPLGSQIRLEFRLSDNSSLFLGEGIVRGIESVSSSDPHAPPVPDLLSIHLDQSSMSPAVWEKILERITPTRH